MMKTAAFLFFIFSSTGLIASTAGASPDPEVRKTLFNVNVLSASAHQVSEDDHGIEVEVRARLEFGNSCHAPESVDELASTQAETNEIAEVQLYQIWSREHECPQDYDPVYMNVKLPSFYFARDNVKKIFVNGVEAELVLPQSRR